MTEEDSVILKKFFEKIIPEISNNWNEVYKLFKYKKIPAKTVLLSEGDVAKQVFFIKKGSLRLWNNDDGKDISMQFFLENQIVASFESFYINEPSSFTIESMEETEIFILNKQDLLDMEKIYPDINIFIMRKLSERLIEYTKYFLSRIKDSPEKRYIELQKSHPEIIERVPDFHIATYIGVTPVSLSRIKQRIKK